eukprot:jgi/Botrbrau1/340/Bobra.0022s0294.1
MILKSGGGVLCVSSLQLVVGLTLLGIYEAYKVAYFRGAPQQRGESKPNSVAERAFSFESPMDAVFYLSIFNNVFSVIGFAGMLHGQKELVTAFFTYNIVQIVVSFHYFVDVIADSRIRYVGEPSGLTGYEAAAADGGCCVLVVFIFFNFALSICATAFAMKAVDEIRLKQRDAYNRISVLADALPFDDA